MSSAPSPGHLLSTSPGSMTRPSPFLPARSPVRPMSSGAVGMVEMIRKMKSFHLWKVRTFQFRVPNFRWLHAVLPLSPGWSFLSLLRTTSSSLASCKPEGDASFRIPFSCRPVQIVSPIWILSSEKGWKRTFQCLRNPIKSSETVPDFCQKATPVVSYPTRASIPSASPFFGSTLRRCTCWSGKILCKPEGTIQ